MMRRASLVLTAAFAAFAFGGAARADELLDCDSGGYRYTYCPADTGYGVELQRQRSNTPCVFGESWGYDDGGVWVDRGCRGTFRLLTGHRPPPPPVPPPLPLPPDPPQVEPEDETGDIIPDWILGELEDEDAEDGREPGYGRADAAIACALYADDMERSRGAADFAVTAVQDVVPRGRRSYDVTLEVELTSRSGRVREAVAECTVVRGGVTAYSRY